MRRSLSQAEWQDISTKIQDPALSLADRAALRLQLFLEHETIVKKPGERIPAYRTLVDFPDIYAPGEKERLQKGHYVHEQGRVCNISSDWEGVLKDGLMARYNLAPEASRRTIDAVLAYADRYEMPGLSSALRQGARGYLEALQAFRILHFSLWASNVYHNTVGRFDQYMYPYFKHDLDSGRFTEDEMLALTEEFFRSFNRDSDLYTGMQQGDNGQSLMLGGCDREGKNAVNELTYVCLTASLNNRLIDPKINLRVNKDTPMELYVRCTELTKQGLGFPQYSNDDVVIPGLVALGYSLENARNYTVAACWEFILPGVAMDIPNIGAVSLADSVHQVIMRDLPNCNTFECLQDKVRQELFSRADALEASLKPLWLEPAPFQTVLMSDPRQDISLGAKYNNYGIHGTGFATAVDQLSAVERYIYQEQLMPADDWLQALSTEFSGRSELKHTLRTQAPKLGRDTQSETIADRLMNDFADSWAGRRNERGGVFRPGTGSAMYYVWHGVKLGALSDGHMPGEPISANFSPSLLVTDVGPLSAISAMARPQLSRVINGGPLTLELHDTVFKNKEALTKVAMLVRSFILLGGHQLQLNAVSRETLLDAQVHPEAHRQLIVRVWGWSGHFIQLDKSYQEQIIQRTSYSI
ncbi:MAG: pyruvate formate-lyase [Clostridiales bacterium]|jgi:pyruvate-formate lyase|nr:pyruvate formate-lyase [Clostridiales bacterium]